MQWRPVCWLPEYIAETEQGRELTIPQIWDATLAACLHTVPHIAPLMRIDEDISKLFKTCHRTWRDGTPLLVSDLIDLTSRLKDVCLPGRPRYTPTGDELEVYEKRWDEILDFEKFRQQLSSEVQADDDGRLSAEQWVRTQEVHKLAFHSIMAMTKEPDADMTEEDWRSDMAS